MYREGDDVGHYSNRPAQREFRAATSAERLIYRRWIRGMIAFYCALLLVSGVVAFMSANGSRTEVRNPPGSQVDNRATASSRPN
jgi:hypothetical protein